MAFRFPGPGGDGFWQALCEGRDLVTEVDASRWAKEAYLHPNEHEPGRSYTFAAGSLGDVSGFDAAFFGISPREAAQLDPQQRLLLELTWEALESGGIRPSALRGSRSAVMIGFSGSDYGYLHSDDLDAVDGLFMTGISASIAANRVSYFYDLRGPSLAIDSACSSALTAFHLACRSVASGESDLAVTGAVNLHLHPMPFIAFSKASMLSHRGRSRAFGASGDGYVRSEGCAIAILKRLEDAVRDGNRIYAVVAGTAINCDGRTNGLTVPSVEAQAALLREAYAAAAIAPEDIDYVEAHGTGTAVGDPIEARALGEALGRSRPAGRPLPIGSVKTNVGHMETVAGMAGIVKALHCLRHRALPASLHFETPNPRIPFDELNLEVVREFRPLDASKRIVIGVNSFGFGGANGHAILESAPSPAARRQIEVADVPLLVSGRSEAALRGAARDLADWLRRRDDLALYDIAHSSMHHRDWHKHRALLSARDRHEAAAQLEAFSRHEPAEAVAAGSALERPGALAFVYSGNGAQWAGMGRRLLRESLVFADALSRVDAAFRRHSGDSIVEALNDPRLDRRIEATEVAQPLLFACQVGITEMLRDWGITPDIVLGHSVGEIAAAWACGALALEEAVRIVFHRSAWQGTTRGAGGMTAVRLAAGELGDVLARLDAGTRLALAAVNGPRSSTVAGAAADLEALEAELRMRGASFARLGLDYAFHSAAMDSIEPGVLASLAGLAPRAATARFVSAVSGEATAGEALGADYWWRNIREPVRFEAAVRSLREAGAGVFMEIGPKPILGGYLAECLGEAVRECRIVPTMAPNADGAEALRRRAFEAIAAGCRVDLGRHFPESAPPVDLPHYPWQRERHWYQPTPDSHKLLRLQAPHPLLGHRHGGEFAQWEGRLDTMRLPACADHRVSGEMVFPAAGFAEMALAACAELRESQAPELEDLTIHAPLILEVDHSKTVRLSVDDDDGRFLLRGRATGGGDAWRTHLSGRIPLHPARAAAPAAFELPADPGAAVGAEQHYAALAQLGLDYGPAFRAVARAWVEPKRVRAELSLPPSMLGDGARALVEPSALDACFQLIVHLQKPDPDGGEQLPFVPVRIGRLCVLRPGEAVRYALLVETQRTARAAETECVLYGKDREPVALLRNVRFRAVPRHDSSQMIALRSRAIPMPLAGTRSTALLPSVARLREALTSRLHGDERLAWRRRYYSVVEPLLEAMLEAFAQEALPALAVLGAAADADCAQRIRRLAPPGELPPAAEIWSELLASHGEHSEEILRLGRIGMHFAHIARGTFEPEPAASATHDDFHAALAGLAGTAQEALPPGERLRVLVVAPEGSSLGARVTAALDRDRSDCVVLAGEHGAVVGAEPFDIALLEAGPDKDPARTLGALRQALAASALLAILQPMAGRSTALANDIVASPGADPGGSPESHALARESWGAAFAAHGFVEETIVEDVPGESAGSFVLLARNAARAADERAEASARSGAWLLAMGATKESVALGERLRAELLQLGQTVELLNRAAADAPAWDTVLANARARYGAIAGVVELSVTGHEARAHAPLELLELQAARCESAGQLLEACAAADSDVPVWLVTLRTAAALLPHEATPGRRETPDLEDAPLWGFARSAASEYPALELRRVDLCGIEAATTLAGELARALLRPDAEDETILTPEGRFALRVDATPLARLRATPLPERASTTLEISTPGLLKNLTWVRRPLRPLGEDQVEIDVRAAGLNFRDVMLAVGQLSDEALETGFAGVALGMAHTGVVAQVGSAVRGLVRGDRVLGFASGSFATRIVASASSVLKMPAGWSFEAAATLPVAFLTAQYALHHLAHLQEGERVLIHGAAGGVGIAAIQIARNAGAEIFATAGSEEKRDIVRLLGADHVLDSRTLDFAGEVLERTGGEGVDVVLNSLAGEAMLRSLQILRPLGRFLELGKRDFYDNSRIGLRPFRHNVSYFGVDVDQLMREKPALVSRIMRDLLAQFEEGTLGPLPYCTFPAADAEAAFRLMQQSRHVGKIVLRLDSPPRPDLVEAEAAPALRLSARGTYLVTGGLGGFGLATARWLAERGARHLVLVGRGAPREEAAAEIATITAAGVDVRVEHCDVADHRALQRLFASLQGRMPPLRGIIHAAGVIRDGLVRNLERGRIEEALRPKLIGALNLHRLTQAMPLDFFVLYSSATTTLGSAGQSNYVAANYFMEVLAAMRRARGLPALAVGFGPIADAGYLARNAAIREQVAARLGDSAMSAAGALDALERLLALDASGLAVLKASRASLGRLASAMRASRFADLRALAGDEAPSEAESGDLQRWLAELDDAALTQLLIERLRKEAAEVLRLPAERIDPAQSLQELGFDSLMGVELMTAVEARFGVQVPVVAVSEIGNLERLATRLVRELRRGAPATPGSAEALGAQAQRLAAQHTPGMSEDEVAAVAQALGRRSDRSSAGAGTGGDE